MAVCSTGRSSGTNAGSGSTNSESLTSATTAGSEGGSEPRGNDLVAGRLEFGLAGAAASGFEMACLAMSTFSASEK